MRTVSRSSSFPTAIDDVVAESVADELDRHGSDGHLSTEAREHVVLAAMGLADSLASRYRGRGIDLEDLRQVARLALVKAAGRYRPSEGPFTSFAVPTITGEIKRHFRDQGWVVRPPRSLQEGRASVVAAQESLGHLLGRDATAREVADLLGFEESAVRETQLCASGFTPASLDAPLSPAGSCLADSIVDQAEPYASIEMQSMVDEALRVLDDRERLVVRLRFVEELSQATIGERIGVSQMQVSRILASITSRLRAHLDTTLAA